MDNHIKVSAIITTYKRPLEILKRAYSSIKHQTYRNIEIIIVDDSPDTFKERFLIKEYFTAEGILYIQHSVNQGACAARNTGIEHATGDAIAFLDDDDEWTEQKIEKQVKCMKESNADLVYTNRHYIINDDTGTKVVRRSPGHRGKVFDRLMEENFIGSTSFPLIKKCVFSQVGNFDVELKASQDYDMWLRIAQEFNVDYIAEPVCVYHVHSGSGITNNTSNKIQGILSVLEKYKDYYSIHKDKYAKRRIALVPNYLKNGNKELALKELIMAIKIAPLNLKTNLKWAIYYITFSLRKKC
jgi:glycosyltransferase involved in cell wall biosynthesis